MNSFPSADAEMITHSPQLFLSPAQSCMQGSQRQAGRERGYPRQQRHLRPACHGTVLSWLAHYMVAVEAHFHHCKGDERPGGGKRASAGWQVTARLHTHRGSLWGKGREEGGRRGLGSEQALEFIPGLALLGTVRVSSVNLHRGRMKRGTCTLPLRF